MRAAIAALTVAGRSPTAASSPSAATSSSMNKGLPSAVSTTFVIVEGSAPVSRVPTTWVASTVVRGSSDSIVAPTMPAPQVGRTSRNSGRASARNATGWSLTWEIR